MLQMTRAVALNKLIEVFRETGTPVDRELARAFLPNVEDNPHEFVSTALGYAFIANCQAIDAIPDLGWQGFSRLTNSDFNLKFLRNSKGSSTLFEELQLLESTLPVESNYMRCKLVVRPNTTIFAFSDPSLDCASDYSISEWSRIFYVIRVVQSALGSNWRPVSIGFISKFNPCGSAMEYFANTDIHLEQNMTFVMLPTDVLQSPAANWRNQSKSSDIDTESNSVDPGSVGAYLRRVLKPYFGENRPSIEIASEITGMSTRSLQRSLRNEGLTYSRMLDQISFQIASQMLEDGNSKIIEVAHSVGYEDPSHFSRAFKRISGVVPKAYRARRNSKMQYS